jgi:hypothetical protein
VKREYEYSFYCHGAGTRHKESVDCIFQTTVPNFSYEIRVERWTELVKPSQVCRLPKWRVRQIVTVQASVLISNSLRSAGAIAIRSEGNVFLALPSQGPRHAASHRLAPTRKFCRLLPRSLFPVTPVTVTPYGNKITKRDKDNHILREIFARRRST